MVEGLSRPAPEAASDVHPNVQRVLRQGRLETASDVAAKLFERRARGGGPGRGLWDEDHIRLSYAASPGVDEGVKRMREAFGQLT